MANVPRDNKDFIRRELPHMTPWLVEDPGNGLPCLGEPYLTSSFTVKVVDADTLEPLPDIPDEPPPGCVRCAATRADAYREHRCTLRDGHEGAHEYEP